MNVLSGARLGSERAELCGAVHAPRSLTPTHPAHGCHSRPPSLACGPGCLAVETPTRGRQKMTVTASGALGAQEKISDPRRVGEGIVQRTRYLQTQPHSSGPERLTD